jgi:hypothetical protein
MTSGIVIYVSWMSKNITNLPPPLKKKETYRYILNILHVISHVYTSTEMVCYMVIRTEVDV